MYGRTDGRSRDYYVTTKIFWLEKISTLRRFFRFPFFYSLLFTSIPGSGIQLLVDYRLVPVKTVTVNYILQAIEYYRPIILK